MNFLLIYLPSHCCTGRVKWAGSRAEVHCIWTSRQSHRGKRAPYTSLPCWCTHNWDFLGRRKGGPVSFILKTHVKAKERLDAEALNKYASNDAHSLEDYPDGKPPIQASCLCPSSAPSIASERLRRPIGVSWVRRSTRWMRRAASGRLPRSPVSFPGNA